MADPSLLLDDSDDDFQYEEVEVMGSDDDDGGASEDLDAALRSLQAFTHKDASASSHPAGPVQPVPGTVTKQPEVIDDFMRNFFVKMGLTRTCEAFESEWYELKATGKLEGTNNVPDVYLRNLDLEEEIAALRSELSHARSIAAKASSTWDTFRKERDFHRMHHKRVAQEKNRLITDIRRLKAHYAKYEPTILELKKKYETAMKEKMLISLERDKAVAKMEAMRSTSTQGKSTPRGASMASSKIVSGSPDGELSTTPSMGGPNTVAAATSKSAGGATMTGTAGATRRSGWSAITGPQKRNPYMDLDFPPTAVKQFTLSKTFKGHLLSVANVALHPTKPILVTASDDKTWKMWHLPDGDLIMCGEGHKDWVAGVDFNPNGTSLASGGGDNTVKIWDFEKQRCVLTFVDHKQAVWGVKYHWSGDILASCSLDHTVRLWDVAAGKCRMAMRGHVDSVNEVCWQPFTANLATASSDKTVSVWDARSGLCTQTFYGHHNSCNSATFNLLGTTLASTDADGVIKLWDTRMIAEIMTLDGGKHPANKCNFDRTGQVLAVASDDGRIKVFNASNGDPISEFSGHDDAVQAVAFDPAAQFLVSCSSDNTFRVWA